MTTPTRRDMLISLYATAAIACSRAPGNTSETSSQKAPGSATPAPATRAGLSSWEPVDEMFRGCEEGCGARVAGGSADIIVQPGARVGQRTYCPVSGVVFTVTDTSPREEIAGRSIYVCCAACAQYFVANRARIVALRKLAS
jgi:hypothetical protein